MWLRREQYLETKDRLDVAEQALELERLRCEQLEKELAITHNNEDWLRTQCNVAQFRADALFQQMTSARLPTPSFEKASIAKMNAEDSIEMTKGGALPSLEDCGDEIAASLGIDHAPDGTLVYRN